MKETIEYYYSIKIDNLYIKKNTYYFTNDKYNYYFLYIERSEKELEDIIKCYFELKNKKIDIPEIILNIKNSFFTKIDDLNYALLKSCDDDKKYDIINIIEFNKKLKIVNSNSSIYRSNWAVLWSSKIDYIESQLAEIKVNNVIRKTINYYIGLAENAIYYINNINLKISNKTSNITLSHKRIHYPNYKLNYLNPFTFIFDIQVRDIAEYLKSVFFAEEDAYIELTTYLKSVKLSNYEYNMLYARLIYPSYYFDEYENIINRHESYEKILKIIDKSNEYEKFLKKAYQEISRYAILEKIDYLIY